jgi:HEPN domain-containing protein
MEPERAFEYWMEMATYDLETARAMLRTERLLYVGFMAHQAVEKALKAHHWRARRAEPPYTHDLWKLIKTSGLTIEGDDWKAELVDELQPLNIEARYPRDKETLLAQLSSELCLSLVERTGRMITWIAREP